MSGVVRRTAAARLDYLQIFLYAGESNFTAAERLIASFDRSANLLVNFPGMGRMRPDLGSRVRTYPVGKYLLFYQVTSGGIDLLRVIHGARDLDALFDDPSGANIE